MTDLYHSVRWQRTPLAHRAHSQAELVVGTVGEGGPGTLITAGIHGDEGPWGALAIQQLLTLPRTALRGTLRLVMAANPTAAESDARSSPLDHLDLNRVFPGDEHGSHSERLGAQLAGLADDADLVIDLHGGGSWCVNAFVFRFGDDGGLAAASGAPFMIAGPDRPGNLIHHARSHGARAVALEMGGRSRDEMAWRDRIAAALLRMLHNAGQLTTEPPPLPAEPTVPADEVRVLRPSRGGVFVPTLREDAIGTIVTAGTVLGQLHDPGTLEVLETFVAPHHPTALLLLRPHVGVMEAGAMAYVVAQPGVIP
jgi:predicted deacylase